MAVHFPVPFWPAASRILVTRGSPSSSLYFRMLAVISIRKESNSPLFQPRSDHKLNSFDFSQSKISVEKCVFDKRTITFCVNCS